MAGLIKINNRNIINNERVSVLCAETGYGLVRIPVEERRFVFLFSIMSKQSLLPSHSTIRTEGK